MIFTSPQHSFFPQTLSDRCFGGDTRPRYVRGFQLGTLDPKVIREIGLPWSEGLRDRTILALGGTIRTCELAKIHGLASHLAGGTHHAHRDRGSGFCIYNDLAVSSRYLINKGLASRVLIFDCDVHQGDGTASILAHDPNIFTCSIHAEKNFPARKFNSDLDVNCPDGMTDDDYLSLVFETLESVAASWHPDFVIYDAGSDVHVDDALGRLSITTDGLYRRDYGVISRIRTYGNPLCDRDRGGYDKDRARVAARHGVVISAAPLSSPRTVKPDIKYLVGLAFPVSTGIMRACFVKSHLGQGL